MLKFTVDNLESVPEAFRSLYQLGGDGKYRLQVEGAVDPARLIEFRENNTTLKGQLERFQAIGTPEELETLKKQKADIEAGKTKDGRKVDEIVDERLGTFKAESEKTITAERTRAEKAEKELARLKISDAAVKKATEFGLRPTAHDDLTARVSSIFVLENGVPVAKDQNGKTLYGKTTEPLTVDEYVAELVEKASHLFEPSSGTGANGGIKPPGGKPMVNPWLQASFNLTRQSEILKTNRDLAKRMASEAGVVIQ